ncbi:MAG TPA: MFS transporter [Steroidobacteraceae bacterium]|nr:MFS transporter [Steroidobacteraceae bacterium]
MISRAQWTVLALVLAVFLVDGMDTQMMAVVVPSLAPEWHLGASAFALALAMGHAGGAAGGALGGVLGDRIGVRNAVILCLVLFGALSLLLIAVHDLRHLELLRLLCGLGLGAAIAPALALLTEFFTARQRSLVISLAFLCSPLGITAAGLLAAYVMPLHGWQALFLVAGVTPLVLAGVLPLLLPEVSPGAPQRATGHGGAAPSDARRYRSRQTVRELWAQIVWTAPVGLFVGFVFTYGAMSLVLAWLPALLAGHGMSLRDAGLMISVWSGSGIVGAPVCGWAAGRWGVRRVTTIAALVSTSGAAAIALNMLWTAGSPVAGVAFYVPLAVAGATANGLIILLYSLGAELFPAPIRSTGLGLAATAGRTGAIATAFLGGRITEVTGVAGFFALTALLLLAACLGVNLERSRRGVVSNPS